MPSTRPVVAVLLNPLQELLRTVAQLLLLVQRPEEPQLMAAELLLLARQLVALHPTVVAQLLLAAIAQRFRVKLAPGQDVHLNPRITLGPQKPIMVELEARGS